MPWTAVCDLSQQVRAIAPIYLAVVRIDRGGQFDQAKLIIGHHLRATPCCQIKGALVAIGFLVERGRGRNGDQFIIQANGCYWHIRKIFNALKPGGIYLVIDHKAEDGSGWRDAGTIHRMGVDTIKQEVLGAGFELALDSDLLANPADDRTKMVFAPGTRGTTDQAFFIFRKPR